MPDVTTAAGARPERRTRWPLLLTLGFGIDFLDTLGIGSFATTTTALKLGNLVEDEDIPGTLNVGHAIPTILEAVLYITVIRVEIVTLVSMLAAGAIGAWFGAGIVSRLPRRKIQLGMAAALLVTAVFITLRQLEFFPPGGEALALTGLALAIGIAANLVLGALATLGIGNYAPSMAVVSLLGMNPTAAFPIMMGSAALILPAAAVRFVRSGRYDRPTSLAMTLGGVPGVLVAAFIVKSLSLDAVRWLVVGVLLYTSVMMWLSARNEARSRRPQAGGLMKITAIRAYQIDLPLHEGSYKWSGGNSVSVFDSTVVAVETDEGMTGWGEICPLGPAYLPAYAAGARAGIAELAPQLLGADPLALGQLNERMDGAMRGHPYVKSAIDMACWDLLGKASGLPVATLMGGHVGDDFALYRAISQESPAQMAKKVGQYRKEGYRKFQLKVGGDPDVDIARIRAAAKELERGDVLVADANTGWTQHAAIRVADAVRDVDVYIEQPCLSYEQCLAVRRHSNRPFVLDEVVDGIDMVVRGIADQAMDVINLKISKVGGLTRARQIRDLCVSLGIAMTIEDTWGGDIITAAIAHLAHSTPERFLFSSTDFNSYVTVAFADGAPQRSKGRLAASRAPGLGVTPRMKLLGRPVLAVEGKGTGRRR